MNNSALEPSSVPPKTNTSGSAYLKIQLDRDTPAILPMDYAQEVVVIPAKRITPMPNMPACVLGLLNQRSRVFWVVDLPQLLDLSPLETKYIQQFNIAVVRVENVPLGLAVQQVKGLMRFPCERIQSSLGTVPSHLRPYLQGCVPQSGEVMLVLDPQAIVNCSTLQDN